jgi:nucleoside-diphosphate-sugar epimerase
MENNQPQQIAVVTGANGFVGSHLVELLLQKGFAVRCIIRKGSNTKWLKDLDIELFDCGLLDPNLLKPVFEGASYVFHIAGVVNAPTKKEFFDGNVLTTKNVLEAALDNPTIKKILITSSLAATGPSARSGEPLTENTVCQPINAYGLSKLEQEKLVATYTDKLPLVVIRPPAVYGPRDTEIFLFFETVKKGILPLLGLFGHKTLSLVHVKDLVNGMFMAANSEQTNGQTYFISSFKEYNWLTTGSLIAEALGCKKPISIRVPHAMVYVVASFGQLAAKLTKKKVDLDIERAKQVLAPSWYCSPEKAHKDFGYTELIPIEEGLKETADWYKSQKWL